MGNKQKRKSKPKNKLRQSVIKDRHQGDFENEDALLAEEITALSAIFQEDFNLISDRQAKEFSINLRAHSDYDGEFTAQLIVRCLPGYPWKAPKLQIVVENDLLKSEAERLHSMLVEQAASTSREGRVMIFNLAEAALEYLADRITSFQLKEKELNASADVRSSVSDGSFASDDDDSGCHAVCDLWGGEDGIWELLDSGPQTLQAKKARSQRGSGMPLKTSLQTVHEQEGLTAVTKGNVAPTTESEDEESDTGSMPEPHATSNAAADLLHRVRSGLFRMGRVVKQSVTFDRASQSDGSSETAGIWPSQDQSLQKDMILGHLLRLACGRRGPLPEALPTLVSQLTKIGVIPVWLEDLVARQPQLFEATFKRVFALENSDISEFKTQEAVSRFWNASPDLLGGSDSSLNSRYLSDFEELSLLGRGGFGHVVLCKNKLDGRLYAMKKIRLKDKNPAINEKIKREVATLSRLQHQHVVRYYQAWFETAVDSSTIVAIPEESSADWIDTANSNTMGPLAGKDETVAITLLYIQMEYCPRTLRGVFDDSTSFLLDKDTTWRVFRQIVEGLVHIHGQGIIHRDLTPNNIFFDARNDIKIGDFGLAKFTNLQSSESDIVQNAVETNSASVEGTGQIGTYFYRAPEVEQAWVHIDDKVDMYSLGVILFELWHPFSTVMERCAILNQLKKELSLPSEWSLKFPQQASLVRLLLSPEPQDRPSAQEVLRSDLMPPRMEDEALEDILRTIQTGENSFVYDQVISAIFDEERIASSMSIQSAEDTHNQSTSWLKAQERVVETSKEVFSRHGAQNFESVRMKAPTHPERERNTVKVVTSSGSILGLRCETRRQFAQWAASQQLASFKRFEICQVYRKGVGSSAPNEYLQGDFDIVGGARALAEAEAIKVAIDIVSKLSRVASCEVRLNHHVIANAVFNWSGVQKNQRANVLQILQCADRQYRWDLIRSQLLHWLPATVVDKLRTAERRFTGNADEVLSRLRGALPQSHSIVNAIEELSRLLSYLRVWRLERLTMDVFMPRADRYYDGIYFQVHLPKESQAGPFSQSLLLAVGGRYDSLLDQEYTLTASPGVVGLTIALQKLVSYIVKAQSTLFEPATEVLVCCRGGGGLLKERMEVAGELWAANVKASFVCAPAPSLTEQYEYANENGIRWLVIITESGLSQSGSVKVRHLDFKTEVEVQRENLAKYFTELGPSLSLKKRAFKYS